MPQPPSPDWRRRYGWTVRERDGWLIGATSRNYALVAAPFLPLALVFANVRFAPLHPNRPDPAEGSFHAFGWFATFAILILVGLTNEVRVHLATGEVRTRRGLFGLSRRHALVRPQVDGVFMSVREDARSPNRSYCGIGIQAGLGRWALYRTMDADRAVAFYRDLKQATGFPGVE